MNLIDTTSLNWSVAVPSRSEHQFSADCQRVAKEEDLLGYGKLRGTVVSDLSEVPSSFRMVRVAAIRALVQAGTYENAERLRGTVDALLSVLRGY